MSLMPNTFLQANDVIRMTSSSCNSYNISTIKSQTFFFWLKNKGPLTSSKFFPYLLFFPSTKFWSSYIAWLYIKRTKLHTKGTPSLIPTWLISTFPFWSLPSLIQPSFWSSIIPKIHSSYCHISKRSPYIFSSLLQNPSLYITTQHTYYNIP